MWSQCDHTIALVSSIHYRRVIAIKSSIHLIMGFWTFGVCFGKIPQCQVFTEWMLSNQTGFESIHLIMRSWTLGFCIGEPHLGVSKTEWKTNRSFKNWTEPRFGVLKTKQESIRGCKNQAEPWFGSSKHRIGVPFGFWNPDRFPVPFLKTWDQGISRVIAANSIMSPD